MNVAFDIDDTISRHPAFFSLISKALAEAGHRVVIITLREDREGAQDDLGKWGITYHELISAKSQELVEVGACEWKAKMCVQQAIEIFFEDMPEVVKCIDHEQTLCLMPIDPEIHDMEGMARPL